MSPTCPVLLRLVCCVFGFFELLLKTFMRRHFLIYIYIIYIYIICIYIYIHDVLGTGTVIGVPSPAVLHIFGSYGPILFPSIFKCKKFPKQRSCGRICGTDARLMTVAGFEAMDVRTIRGMGFEICRDDSREEASAWCSPAWSVLSLCVCHIPLLMSDISMKFFEIPSHIFSYFLIRPDKTQLLVC